MKFIRCMGVAVLIAVLSLSISSIAETLENEPTSRSAVAAKEKQDASVRQAVTAYTNALVAANQQYKKELKIAMDAALQSKNLEEANRIDTTLKDVEKQLAELKGKKAGSPDEADSKRIIDLMPLIDQGQDAMNGVWTATKDGITSDNADQARLRIPYQPPAEYDFQIEFTRVSGNRDIVQIASQADHHFAWRMAAWYDTISGFEMLHGRGVRDNGIAVKTPHLLMDRTRHTSVLQVRAGSVRAIVDGKLISEYKTDFSEVSLPGDLDIKGGYLGLGSLLSPTTFHIVQIREVTGKGRALR